MGISPLDFWSMTPDEWYYKLTGWRAYQKDMKAMSRVDAWYSGYYSQANLQKAGLRSAVESTLDAEEVEEIRNTELNEGRKIWLDSQKT